MLPPLNLADNKGGCFSRKRVDGGQSTGSTRKRSSVQIIRPSPRKSINEPTPRTNRSEYDDGSTSELTNISTIPREFFVVETNAVLVPRKYPPNQYKSSLNAQEQWETVVFPALTPHNRQQVLYLRQTMDKMRASMPEFEDKNESTGPETEADGSVLAERRRLMVEYTSQETQIYSYCFHELARQIKCICKEQSDLLHEIRERYDAAVARLIGQLQSLDKQRNQQQDKLMELSTKYQLILEENKKLGQKIEQLERQVKAGSPVVAAQAAFRRRFRGKALENNDKEDKSDSESDIDEEEIEWRRQRDRASVTRPSITAKHDSTKELHLAATRLQGAFQKFQARKEQTRITLRVEKQAAALDIQRSYRGFRERQLALHRRAVMRTIMRQREENAAVELMQANVRAYFLNRRRSAKLKLSAVSTLKLGDSEVALVPVPIPSPTPVFDVEVLVNETSEEIVSKELPDPEPEDTKSNPRQALVRLLKTFRELASVISTFQVQSGKSEDTSESGQVSEEHGDLSSRPLTAVPSEIFDVEDVELFQQTMQEAQALVGSLHVVLGTVPEEKSVSDDDLLEEDEEEINTDDAVQTDLLDLEEDDDKEDTDAVQTDVDAQSEANSFEDDENSINIPFGERDALRLQNYAELHLDDSLWSSATYYPASRRDMAETEALLALVLSSREQKKRLVTLKQFISDIYDTIVGKLKDVHSRKLSEMITSRCHLALSFTEWKQQRSLLFSRAVAADQPGEQTIPVNFSIEQLTREHFRCRLGLPQLIDAALANLVESIEDFAAVDPDVKRFQEFMTNERSEEELVFCCICRYLCAHRLQSDESPAGSAPSSYHRQPMFHPVTMRDVIDIPHALELAKLLFRVEDEAFIIESDTHLTEVENAVYRQYLPTNGFQQFQSIISSFFIDPDTQAAAVSSITGINDEETDQILASTCRRPDGSPRHASAMLRPTNYNQFHAKQYNVHAARSPVVRQQIPATRWLYYEEVLALLMKYRGEMNHFHLFSYWVQELFGLAASGRAQASQVKLLDDTAFVETLMPLSLGPTERELRNIFHNSLRQRKLHVLMPLRVFTSVALLLLRNGQLSVSTYAPMQKPSVDSSTRQRSLSIREENEDKEWRALALQWRTQEALFEAAIEAIYHDPNPEQPDKPRAAHALQLLQLRQELYDLFASRAGRGRDLKRAHEIYEILVNERLTRVGGDTRMLDVQLGSTPSLGAWFTTSLSYF
ncbi:hypothetical protein V7S43_000479 [Phytophthora oleae]|uniref:Uncharacterized protein n=1 Tax=Phytophthora oleae TaxID=2107226 RepID=A0ABD3G9D7_9STRA